MILLRLFLVFSYIGLFNFGGGYAMLSFIQQEVVQKRSWMTEAEFTDVVAISQSTPGPIGINCATYSGYTAVMNDPEMQVLSAELIPDHPRWFLHCMGIVGSVLASLSVLWLPFIVMILVSKLILRYKDSPALKGIFGGLRPAIIGLLASAALALMNTANFGEVSISKINDVFAGIWCHDMIQFCISVAIFCIVFWGMWKKKFNIIYCTLACGMLGILLYKIIGI